MTDDDLEEFRQEMDAAHLVIRKANIAALKKCKKQGYSCSATYQALWQESAENYAKLVGSDLEAIRQFREFLDDWEASVKGTYQ
jgi:hypothetical protein